MVVDFTFQMIRRFWRASATAWASMVLPVPGSPLIRRGFCRVTAMFTVDMSSLDATYWSLPVNFWVMTGPHFPCMDFPPGRKIFSPSI